MNFHLILVTKFGFVPDWWKNRPIIRVFELFRELLATLQGCSWNKILVMWKSFGEMCVDDLAASHYHSCTKIAAIEATSFTAKYR